MTYKAVIFDFGGVFTTSPVERFAEFEREHDLPSRFIGNVIKQNHHTNAWAQFERAEIDLETFDVAFADETRAAGFEISGRKLVSLLDLSFHGEMIEALHAIKKAGFQTGCITNNLPKVDSAAMVRDDDPSTDKMETLREIFSIFDHVIESAKAGMRKPEPRIYEAMCAALDLEPDACIFVDDLGINLKPARAMGMATVKVPFGDVTPAIADLRRLISF